MGPTPGRTSGNPSSPGDVPGFGGGGGSFAWTYNNLQPQLSASIAAGAGAAGLTAGAAALVSTLGLDIGLTVSAAGPVGAVVGALTGLGFLFADLFGGGPDIPRELRLPAHSGTGLRYGGQTDQVNQNADPAPISGDIPLQSRTRTTPTLPSRERLGIMAIGNTTAQDCREYAKDCARCGSLDFYDCEIAPSICRYTPNGEWSNCVRDCLQVLRATVLKDLGCAGSYFGIPGSHVYCWGICL